MTTTRRSHTHIFVEIVNKVCRTGIKSMGTMDNLVNRVIVLSELLDPTARVSWGELLEKLHCSELLGRPALQLE